MKPRNYQVELYEKAKDKNVIIKLNTGTGKTFIASMLIKHYLNSCDGKQIFLLVKNASLAYQHFNSLKEYLFLESEIGIFYGQMEGEWVDNWKEDQWSEKLSKLKIIVMTARVFLDILNHNKYSLRNTYFLIFDEVHHLSKDDDYAQISVNLTREHRNIKVLGLTACLIKGLKNMRSIKNVIEELERKLNCVVITSLNHIACDFSESIKEKIIPFSLCAFPTIDDKFDTAICDIGDIYKSFEMTIPNEFSEIYNQDNPVGNFKKYLNECSSVLKTLGLIPCRFIIQMFIEDFQKDSFETELLGQKEKSCLEMFIKSLKNIKEEIEKIMSTSLNSKYSHKFLILIQQLLELKQKNENTMTVLVFVKQRIHALVLHELLSLFSQKNPELSFINSRFVIGHGQCLYPKKLKMTVLHQNQILKQYRNKEFNILIATDVVEEGLNVPHCNVVIKFDEPQDFRSYIQSKGRARSQDSQYFIFTSEFEKTKNQIELYHSTNKQINKVLETKAIDIELDDDSISDNIDISDSWYDFIPYGPDGPRITLNSASSVLSRYIGKLRSNGISESKIIYHFTKKDLLFESSLLLPMPSPYLDEIKGKVCTNKKRTKQFANLEACKILHKFDELDKYLLPYDRYSEETVDNLKGREINEINKYKKYVAKKLIPDSAYSLSNHPNQLYLYSIRYTPNVFRKLGIDDISMFNLSYSIGFVSTKLIHDTTSVIKFPVYLVGGMCQAEIKFEKAFYVSYLEWSLILTCHKTLFSIYALRIHKFNNNISFDPLKLSSTLFVTVLKNYNFDFRTIEDIINSPYVFNLSSKTQNSWVGSVIRPIYLKKEFGAYIITEVCNGLNAQSYLSDMKMTLEEYCCIKYQISLDGKEKSLPLVKATRLTTILSCVYKEKRLKRSKKLLKINERKVFFIPTLTECISLHGSVWTELCIFPTINYRLNQLLVLEEFAMRIDFINFQNLSGPFDINFDQCFNISNIESDESDQDINTFINNIFPCFTAKMCNDGINLEQLEILGDCFLKYITSKYLYHFSEATDNEGKLTQKRSRLISNKNLFNLALKSGLENYFFYLNFDPKFHYLPPNFVNETSPNNKREFVEIKSKNVADCVEAIIGAMLINYGEDCALKFMKWLGLVILPDSEDCFDVKVQPPELFLNKDLMDKFIPQSIDNLENILKYRFNYKGYAVQAITHPSSVENRKFSCYQRLEFLGDSVIDFLVTVYIMLKNENLSPGKITNLRSALVSNNTFAYLSAKFGFHKFLNYFDQKIFAGLPTVVETLLENRLESNNLYLRKSEEFKVIVKILGDIFESIAGAIFVDSSYNLKVVWEIYKELMKEPLEKFFNKIPKNKISMLYEKYPLLTCTFEIEEITNLVKLTAIIPEKEPIVKIERNKNLCKLALAEELNI